MLCNVMTLGHLKFPPRSRRVLPFVMGWFSTSKPEPPNTASRQDRQKCWENRDAYYACLDDVGVVKAGEEGSVCAKQRVKYEESCAKSWVCDYIAPHAFLVNFS